MPFLKMETYKIEVWEEMGGYMTIKANSKQEAEEMAEQHLHNHGMNTADGIEVNVIHREVNIN